MTVHVVMTANGPTFYDDAVWSTLPAGAVAITSAQFQTWIANQSSYVLDGSTPPNLIASPANIPQLQAQKNQSLSSACSAAIMGGFASSALGSAHTYPSGGTDQANLATAAIAAVANASAAGWTTLLWCETGGAWAMVSHTAAQVQQVAADWITFRTAKQQELIALKAGVTAASTAAAIQAFAWT